MNSGKRLARPARSAVRGQLLLWRAAAGRKESANARRCRHQARPPAIQGAGSRRGPPAPGDGRLPLDLAAPGRGLAVEPADERAERARPRAEAPPDSVRRFEIAIAAGDAGQARAKVAGDLK